MTKNTDMVFKINDKVRVLTNDDGDTLSGLILPGGYKSGLVGTILKIDIDGAGHVSVGVAFDEDIMGHFIDEDVDCPSGYGWCFTPCDLFLEVPEEEYGEYDVTPEIGDWVTVEGNCSSISVPSNLLSGSEGDIGKVVACIEQGEMGYDEKFLGIIFDRCIGGHSFESQPHKVSHCKLGHGWWFKPKDLKVCLNKPHEAPEVHEKPAIQAYNVKVGDRVKLNCGNTNNTPPLLQPDSVATVGYVDIDDNDSRRSLLSLIFDEDVGGHDLDNFQLHGPLCDEGYGWFMRLKDVEVIQEDVSEDDTSCDDTSCDDTSCDDTSCDDTSCDDTSCDDTSCSGVEVGDTVRIKYDRLHVGPDKLRSKSTATVAYIDVNEEAYGMSWLSLIFDDNVDGHDLENMPMHEALCEDGHGWFIYMKNVEIVRKGEVANTDCSSSKDCVQETAIKVGDYVRVLRGMPRGIQPGYIGKVVIKSYSLIGVAFNSNISGHGLDGECESGHGWHFLRNELEVIKLSDLTEEEVWNLLKSQVSLAEHQ